MTDGSEAWEDPKDVGTELDLWGTFRDDLPFSACIKEEDILFGSFSLYIGRVMMEI